MMTNRKLLLTSLFAAVILCGTLAWSQAVVDESLETTTIFVDATKGSDSNPGTKPLPLKTVAAAASLAVSNNQAGVGTKVIINPGTYRESITLQAQKNDTSLPITFQAATTGTAIISGADVWTGWKVYSGNSSIYTNPWTNKWGMCQADDDGAPAQEDIVLRQEMIFVNGTALTQVMTSTAMRVSTFYVDETHSTVYVWPPSGTDMNTAMVEVATRPNLLFISGKNNMVIRGLVFQYANSCRNDSAVPIQGSATNILLDRNFFNWNNATGIKLTSTINTTVQNSVANHNGIDGMKGLQTKYDLWQHDRARYNGWRGAQGVYYNWGVSGMHFVRAHTQTVKDVDSSFNQTFGFHWDTDNENVTADSLVSAQNLLGGGFIEKSQGPMTVSNSSFCNGSPFAGPDNLGFELRNSTNLTFTGNTLLNNETQWLVIGDPGGIPVTNWETGENYKLITQNVTMSNNVTVGTSEQNLFTDGALGGSDWTKFQSTLSSDYNTWWNSKTKVFSLPVPEVWTKHDFAGWQAETQKDAHSAWKSPGNPGADCKLKAAKSDYWFIMSARTGYQTVNRGVAATWNPTVIALAFSGTVTLASDGVQNIPGATASFSPASIVNSGSTTFTVTTTAATPKGTYPITLISNSGDLTRTATVSLIVQ